MKTVKLMFCAFALSVVWVSAATANYFSNPQTGVNLNVGSAPNPVPRERIPSFEPVPVPPPIAPAPPPPRAEAPPPLVAQAPPAPPPMLPPPPPQRFVLFFDFGVAELSSDARLIVREAIEAVQQQRSARIIIVGHTDTVGSRAYNQRLSERRALAVKNEMVRAGIDEEQIATVGRNFADPIVPTGPGVREPQNRRAVIDLGGLVS
jgi:outer membrane protein OmpA-like peptidoglycan-associated protein